MTREGCSTADSAAAFLPRTLSLRTLGKAVRKCQGCPLYCDATQAVFGQGPQASRLFFVGEQPGDQEDRAGLPFVGPAGRLLDQCLMAAGIDRKNVYVTNAVKHFKWVARGKRRIHARPTWRETMACRPWLLAELEVLKPSLVICMGATAAQSLLGRDYRLTQHRREIMTTEAGQRIMATVHPSALLRIPDADARHAARAEFIGDLAFAARSTALK